METSVAYEGWAVVELMGHRRLAGLVSEVSQYGATMLRLDIPGEGEAMTTQFYGGASIYCLTPATEEAARAVAMVHRPHPAYRWALPTPRVVEGDEVEYARAEDLPFD